MVSIGALATAALAMAQTEAQAQGIKAGAAQIDISTRHVIPMGGYGTFFLGTPRTNGVGIHDPLYASAVIFEDPRGTRTAIVVLDAVGLSGAQISRIEKAAREAVDPNLHLLVSATHTHHSPDTLGLWGSLPRSGRDARYSQLLETAAVQAVRDAFARLEPARLTQRSGNHSNSTSLLANADERSDDFVALSFYSENDDRLLGTLTQWSAHPTVIGMKNNALSADFVGGFRHSLSATLGNVPHIFVNGVIGNVYALPAKADDADRIDDAFPQGDRDPDVKSEYANASTVGHRLAKSVLSATEGEVDNSQAQVSVCHVPIQFPVDNTLFKLASNLRVVETKVRSGQISSRVSAVTVGPFVFTSLPGEVFPKVIHRLETRLFEGRLPIWVGLGQDWLGYFVDEEDYDKPNMKYWTDLSMHHTASKNLVIGLEKALQGKDCRNFEPIE